MLIEDINLNGIKGVDDILEKMIKDTIDNGDTNEDAKRLFDYTITR